MLKKRPFEVLDLCKHLSEKAKKNAILTEKAGYPDVRIGYNFEQREYTDEELEKFYANLIV